MPQGQATAGRDVKSTIDRFGWRVSSARLGRLVDSSVVVELVGEPPDWSLDGHDRFAAPATSDHSRPGESLAENSWR